jgi:ribonuclease III
LVIAEWLLEKFQDEPEGSLARRHTALVRREALARVASAIDLGSCIILSLGEEGAGGRDNQAILADAFEAVIAALYLDGGLRSVSRFMREAFLPIVEDSTAPPIDPKTALQEWAQARSLPLPRYEIMSRSGPDHDPTFEVLVTVEGLTSVSARGQSKRSAEKEAAAEMMRRLEDSETQ